MTDVSTASRNTLASWEAKCDAVLKEFNLRHLTVRVNPSLTVRHAQYFHPARLIELSSHIANASDAILREVMIHEMAHALTPGHNHDAVWQSKCALMGGNPSQFTDLSDDEDSTEFPEIIDLAKHPEPPYVSALWASLAPPFESNGRIKIPNKSEDEYYSYQIDAAIAMILCPNNILLADEMGVGKTIEVIMYMNYVHPRRILIICPNSVKYNWLREIEKWCIHTYNTEIANSTICMYSDLTIINYEALPKWPFLSMQQWDLIVCDEVHYIKNTNAIRSKAVHELKATKKIGCTGTPIPNYPWEAYSILHWLDPKEWPEFSRMNRYCSIIGNNKYGRNLTEFQNKLRANWMIRRLKKDVLSFLPKMRYQVIEIPSTGFEKLIEEEKKLWNSKGQDVMAKLQEIVNSAEDASEIEVDSIIDALKYNKRAFFEEMARIRHEIGRAKIALTIEHLENLLESGEKIVCFGHHVDVVKQIHDKFKNIAVFSVGETDLATRDENIKKFQTDPNVRLFIGNKTAGEGITLTAAHHAIHIEMDWTPSKLDQLNARLHRIGQEDSVLIQYIVLENSLDAYMMKKIVAKRRSINKALNK